MAYNVTLLSGSSIGPEALFAMKKYIDSTVVGTQGMTEAICRRIDVFNLYLYII
ncbi:MAG: hypothetical protein P9M12_06345 [Candidatus Aceula lacicola]|nr:hypothetical protein [Candidatus Aceula lacicola]